MAHGPHHLREEWDRLPETIDVRIIRYTVSGRHSEITIVTTLLDAEAYPAEDVAALYKYRWECELDIRSIKSVMGMTWLTCHTPEMLQRELMAYLLAYNIIRITMCDAAKISDRKPRDLSFKNAKDSWLHLGDDGREPNDYAWLLWSIADAPLRKRARDQEPRKIKRRSSKYEKLKQSRALEKAALNP
jgi:putative transposase